MLRREALLSLISAPLAWLGWRKPDPEPRGDVFVSQRDGDWHTPPGSPGSPWEAGSENGWTLEKLAREYAESHELYCKVISRL